MPIFDLTGYTWVGNSSIYGNPPTGYGLIDFISNNTTFHEIAGVYPNLTYDNTIVCDVDDGIWVNEAYRTIVITGGTDVTNANLKSWLEEYGTLTAPIPANTYNLTHTLTNLTKGNITIQITPDTGYTYPTTLTVTNGTLVSYDNTTGVAVINGDDTTIVSGECAVAPTPSGYEVELYGDDGSGEYVYVQINDDPTWYYAQLGYDQGFVYTNIPNAYAKSTDYSIAIPNVSKIKIGTGGNPTSYSGPYYSSFSSTGDFTNLTFASTGGHEPGLYPGYTTSEVTMTQDSKITFYGDD